MLAVTDRLDLHPNYAFSAVNLLLLTIAAAVVARRLGWALTAVLFLGPIVWWVGKAQTEAFTFSVLAIAMASLRDRPGLALVCLGAAATQNPPFAILLAVAAVAAVLARPGRLRDRGFLAGAAAGGALALLQPVYYELRLGRLSSLHGVEQHVPTVAEVRFPLIDLNFGLIPNALVLTLLVVALVAVVLRRRPRRLAEWDVAVAVLAVPVFLYAFAQSPSLAAGGTPSMTRYALWLIPLAIPPLARVAETRSVPGRWRVLAAAASAAWTAVTFVPSRPESDVMQPTRAASWVWRHHPRLENPLAEVFYLKVAHTFGSPQPAALPSCSKVLVVYGEWARCPVGALPARCRAAPCYANRHGDRYEFADAPLRGAKALPPPAAAGSIPGSVTLRPVDARLGAGSVRLAGTDLPLASGGSHGAIDSSQVVGRAAIVRGWAADPGAPRSARAVLVFADGRPLGAARPTLPRPDVARVVGAGAAMSGFSVAVPLRLVQSATRQLRVEIVAVGRRDAAKLAHGCDARALQDFGC